jgi:predicted nucleic acid binding AN1-type Zn finger protein
MICHDSDNSSRRLLSYSSELDIEKELGVDKLELSKTVKEKTASDSQKLAILKMALRDLKKKTETKKKSKQGNDFEYETVKRHIEEVEEAVMQQVRINDQLSKNIEDGTSSLDREIPRRGSEQIEKLQSEVQNIQYILQKLAEENNNKGKNKISRKTGILLRRKLRVCGCSKASTDED